MSKYEIDNQMVQMAHMAYTVKKRKGTLKATKRWPGKDKTNLKQ